MINYRWETEKGRVGRSKEACPVWWKTNVGSDCLGCGDNISQPLPAFEVWAPSPAPAGYSSSEMGAWRTQPLTDYTRGQVQGVMDGPRGWGWRPQVCASPGWTRVIWLPAAGIFSGIRDTPKTVAPPGECRVNYKSPAVPVTWRRSPRTHVVDLRPSI